MRNLYFHDINRRSFLKKSIIAGFVLSILTALSGCFNFRPLASDYSVVPHFHEDLTVVLLGTGIPMDVFGRSKAAVAIMAGNKTFLVDCGGNVVGRLIEAGIPPQRVSVVFFTHHHSDHNSGFMDLLISGTMDGVEKKRKNPLFVYGPTNTKEIIGRFMNAMEWDINIRRQHTGEIPEPFMVNITEKDEGIVFDEDGIKITAFMVDHGIVKPTLGYRIEYKGKAVVISGDTLPCESLIRNSKNADILIYAAYSKNWIDMGIKKHPEMRKIANQIMNYQSSTLEAAQVAKKANVKHLVFTHLMPAPTPMWIFERSWVSGAGDIFKNKITVGRDLMTF